MENKIIYCEGCGKEIDNEADVCLNCGKQVGTKKVETKPKKKSALWLLIIIPVLIIGFFVGYNVYIETINELPESNVEDTYTDNDKDENKTKYGIDLQDFIDNLILTETEEIKEMKKFAHHVYPGGIVNDTVELMLPNNGKIELTIKCTIDECKSLEDYSNYIQKEYKLTKRYANELIEIMQEMKKVEIINNELFFNKTGYGVGNEYYKGYNYATDDSNMIFLVFEFCYGECEGEYVAYLFIKENNSFLLDDYFHLGK